MKAIIIEEARFVDLTNALELHKLQADMNANWDARCPEGVPVEVWKGMVDSIHRSFHFVVVRWAQSHGASCVPR